MYTHFSMSELPTTYKMKIYKNLPIERGSIHVTFYLRCCHGKLHATNDMELTNFTQATA